MIAHIASSHAECAYCGTQARPNAMYCMNCGQIVVAARTERVHPSMRTSLRSQTASADARIIELEFLDGKRTKIDGTAVLGRRPEVTARNSFAQAVAVPDDSKSVSRAHAIIDIRGQAVSISDAGSANGSTVERNDAVLTLRSGCKISLRSGDRIWLGNVPIVVHITHQVAREARH
ncbi:MAG: FHA domain-containing protein [Leucobacter sp.]